MLPSLIPVLLGAALLTSACSPVYNWRDVRVPQANLKVLLPCKPDHGTRTMKLAGQDVEVVMVGCETGSVLFAVSHVDMRDESKLQAALAQWKNTMLANMRAQQGMKSSTFATDRASTQPIRVRLTASGQRPDGSAVTAQAEWLVRGTHLYHAVVYAEKLNQEAVETFFSGIEIQ